MDSPQQQLSDEIRAVVETLLQQRSVEGRWYGTSFYALGSAFPPANARRCEHCGEWATDYEQPEPISVLLRGVHIAGHFYCDACEGTAYLESLQSTDDSNPTPGIA